ncbi:MAG TPA: metallophosphoesterase [Gammaproteobacteria bacterium]|jgi:hypothetical protein
MRDANRERPKAATLEELGFTPRPMVNWFDPRLLLQTAVKVFLSSIFGAYADKRELQAVLNHEDEHDYAGSDELWFDYAADLGDGWNAGYSVARLLGAERLAPAGWRGEPLPRGELLIFGGDEVYPVASRDQYRDRLKGPYESALPWVEDEREAPALYAIPGNHDWYDGLTSFTRLFCQQRWIGGWRTRQSRSYFAIRLPHNWWLWGVDVQLESDIDGPQKAYFNRKAAEMAPGDRVILCTPEPGWVYAELGDRDALRNLHYLEEQVIREQGASLALVIAGDLHHYCRYAQEGGERQFITAGGGGAFLHGTHNLPEALQPSEPPQGARYQRKKCFPEERTSAALLWGNLLFPLRNVGFSLFLGGIYLLYAWLLQSASVALAGGQESFMVQLSRLPFSLSGAAEAGMRFLGLLAYSPVNVVFFLLLVLGMGAFVEAPTCRKGTRYLVGAIHGLAHLLLNIALIWGFAILNLVVLPMKEQGLALTGLFILEMLAGGALAGGLLMGLYLLLTNRLLGLNRTAALSSLRVADYKSFLRLHIDERGLTIYPIGVDRVPKRWRFVPQGPKTAPWFEPDGKPLTPRLLEAPICIRNH